MARRKLLPIPEGITFKIERFRFRCGTLAIELLSFSTEAHTGVTVDAIQVVVKCNTILGGVMPYDAVKALANIGVKAKATVVKGQTNDKVNYLTNQIDLGHRVAIFTGLGSGHWLTVIGYNRNRKEFEVVDTAKSAKRNAHGLTTYTYQELMTVWGRQAWLPRLASRLCARSSRLVEFRMRLWSPPFTALALT